MTQRIIDFKIVRIERTDDQGNEKKYPAIIAPAKPPSRYGERFNVTGEIANQLSESEQVSIIALRGKAKSAAPKYDSDYYWDVVNIKKANGNVLIMPNMGSQPDLTTQPQTSQAAGAATAPASQTPATKQTSQPASSPATAQQGSVTQGAPPAPAQHEGEFTADRIKRVSIERQKALSESNIFWALIYPDMTLEERRDLKFHDIVGVATAFEAYLSGGFTDGAPQKQEEGK